MGHHRKHCHHYHHRNHHRYDFAETIMQKGLAINQGGDGGRGVGEIKIGIETKASINARPAGNRKQGGPCKSFAGKYFLQRRQILWKIFLEIQIRIEFKTWLRSILAAPEIGVVARNTNLQIHKCTFARKLQKKMIQNTFSPHKCKPKID